MTASNAPHRPVSVLLVGPPAALGQLPGESTALALTVVGSLARARDLVATGKLPAPELIVLSQDRPGQFAQAEIEALRRQVPLARLVRLGGSWCEGELRSGRPPSGCQSVYWHQWPARLGRALEAIVGGKGPFWVQPSTITAEETALADAAVEVPQHGSATIAVAAERASTASALADLCRAWGYEATILAEHASDTVEDAVALLWDTVPESLADARRAARLRSRAGGAPLLALCGFVRPQQLADSRAAGVAQVVAKPYRAADVFWHLQQVRR